MSQRLIRPVLNLLMLIHFSVSTIDGTDNIKPSSQSLYEGKQGKIQCFLKIPVVWKHDGKPMDTNNDTLYFKAISKSDNGLYECRGHGSDQVVTASSKLFVVLKTEERINPRIFKGYVGTKAKFVCDTLVPPKWFHGDGNLPPDAIVNGKVLIVEATLSNVGIYKCYGKMDTFLLFLDEVLLIVFDQSQIEPQSLTVFQRREANFVCKSDQLPLWLHNDETLPVNAIPSGDYKLEIRDAQYYNQGSYECLGYKNGVPFNARANLSVLIYEEGRVSPRVQHVYEGQPIAMYCLSDSEVEWQTVTSLEMKHRTFRSGVNHYFLLEEANSRHNGLYRCIGKTAEYSFYSEAIVKVEVTPPLRLP